MANAFEPILIACATARQMGLILCASFATVFASSAELNSVLKNIVCLMVKLHPGR